MEILHHRVIWKIEIVVRSFLKASEMVRSWSSHHFEIDNRFLRETSIIAIDDVALTLIDLDCVSLLTSHVSGLSVSKGKSPSSLCVMRYSATRYSSVKPKIQNQL